VSWRSIGVAAREIASTAARAMPTITVVPHVGVLDALRWEADVAAPGGYGEWVRVAQSQSRRCRGWARQADCVWRGAQGRSRQASGASE